MRAEVGDVALPEIEMLESGDSLDGRELVYAHPDAVEESVPVQSVPEKIRVEALLQKQAIGPGGSQDGARRIRGEARDGALRSEELLPPPDQ